MQMLMHEESTHRAISYKIKLMYASDIDLVQTNVSCTRQRAIDALWDMNKNVSAAIYLLKSNTPLELKTQCSQDPNLQMFEDEIPVLNSCLKYPAAQKSVKKKVKWNKPLAKVFGVLMAEQE